MNNLFSKFASGLTFINGAMEVFVGWRVLLGKVPDYYVINWLPVYNYTVGILTVFVTAILFWTNSKPARPVTIATFGIPFLSCSSCQPPIRMLWQQTASWR